MKNILALIFACVSIIPCSLAQNLQADTLLLTEETDILTFPNKFKDVKHKIVDDILYICYANNYKAIHFLQYDIHTHQPIHPTIVFKKKGTKPLNVDDFTLNPNKTTISILNGNEIITGDLTTKKLVSRVQIDEEIKSYFGSLYSTADAYFVTNALNQAVFKLNKKGETLKTFSSPEKDTVYKMSYTLHLPSTAFNGKHIIIPYEQDLQFLVLDTDLNVVDTINQIRDMREEIKAQLETKLAEHPKHYNNFGGTVNGYEVYINLNLTYFSDPNTFTALLTFSNKDKRAMQFVAQFKHENNQWELTNNYFDPSNYWIHHQQTQYLLNDLRLVTFTTGNQEFKGKDEDLHYGLIFVKK